MKTIESRYYRQIVDTVHEAERCRELWLCVIDQAVKDSRGKTESRHDLGQTIKSDWWQEVFTLAGLGEREYRETTTRILHNLTLPRQKGLTKRRLGGKCEKRRGAAPYENGQKP